MNLNTHMPTPLPPPLQKTFQWCVSHNSSIIIPVNKKASPRQILIKRCSSRIATWKKYNMEVEKANTRWHVTVLVMVLQETQLVLYHVPCLRTGRRKPHCLKIILVVKRWEYEWARNLSISPIHLFLWGQSLTHCSPLLIIFKRNLYPCTLFVMRLCSSPARLAEYTSPPHPCWARLLLCRVTHWALLSVLVIFDCHNKTPWIVWLLNNSTLFVTVVEAGSQIRVPMWLGSGEGPLLHCRLLASHHVFTWWKEGESSLGSLC